MSTIPDFTATEKRIVRATQRERFGADVPVDQVALEMRLSPGARELSSRPGLYREGGGPRLSARLAANRYRAQSYHRLHQMFAPSLEEFDYTGDCAIAVLQVQADRQRDPRRPNLSNPTDNPTY